MRRRERYEEQLLVVRELLSRITYNGRIAASHIAAEVADEITAEPLYYCLSAVLDLNKWLQCNVFYGRDRHLDEANLGAVVMGSMSVCRRSLSAKQRDTLKIKTPETLIAIGELDDDMSADCLRNLADGIDKNMLPLIDAELRKDPTDIVL